jgi:hypothetical protein
MSNLARLIFAITASGFGACAGDPAPEVMDSDLLNYPDGPRGPYHLACSEISARVGETCDAHEAPCIEYICYSSMNGHPDCENGIPTQWAPLATIEEVFATHCYGIKTAVLAECEYRDPSTWDYRTIWSMNCDNTDL